MRFSIGSKLWAGFIPILLLLIVVALSGYGNIVRLNETAQLVAHTHEVRARLALLLSSLQEAETALRGYVITGDARTLAPYDAAVQQVGLQQRELKQMIQDNPAQQNRLEQLAPLLAERLVEFKAVIQLRRERGFEATRSHIMAGRGIRLTEQLRQLVGAMADEEVRLLTLRENATRRSATFAQQTMLLGFAVACLLVLGAAWLLTRHIAGPLNQLTGAAETISAGDVSARLLRDQRSDELGVLQRAFARMTEALYARAALAKEIAAGNLAVQVALLSEHDTLGYALSTMVDNLRQINRELQDGMGVLAAVAGDILTGTGQIATSTAETATAVAQTSSTVEEVKQTALVASQKAKHVSEAAQKVAQVAQGGKQAVDGAVEGMQSIRDQMEQIADSIVRLSEQTQAIGEIIATVNDLAEQSNLLAVNAAIEAAKAGEQGKGFAVVAQEIKSLAEQSKQATVQVRVILGDIQKATGSAVLATEQGGKAVEAGVKQSNEAGEAIRQLAASVDESAQAAAQIAVSAQQQLAGMDQLALAMDNIQLASGQNLASSRQAEQSAQQLHTLGQRLKELLERYRI